jgi:hypothetical protein
MIFTKPALALAGLVAISQAFLLPPTVSSSDNDIIEDYTVYDPANAPQFIEVECKDCPVPMGTGPSMFWMVGTPSKFSLKFNVNHKYGELDVLKLNDVQIFPFDPELSTAPIMVTQTLIGEAGLTDTSIEPKAVKLGYELTVDLVKEPSPADMLTLLNVRVQVVELDDKWVDGLDAVQLDVVLTRDSILFGNLRNTKTTNPALGSGEECTTMFCKFRQTLKDRLSGFTSNKGKNGCGKGAKKMGGPHGGPNKYGNHGFNGHNGHRGHRGHILAKVMRGIKSVVLHIVLPFCIGIAAGMAAIFIGTLVGSTIVCVWRIMFRRGQKGPYERVEQEDLTVEQGEKDPSMFKEDVAPPVYEESDIVSVVEEKSADN